MKGTLIVIDGTDGCGKATQVELLKNHYIEKGYTLGDNLAVVDFPRYNKDSAMMVEKYLKGDLGSDIDLHAASLFYSIDRYLSYKNEEWGRIYDNGGIVIADRYTSSNIIHQGSQSSNSDQFMTLVKYIRWIGEIEYNDLGIPRPDYTVFLTISDEANEKLLDKRMRETGQTDILESNRDYQRSCRKTIVFLKAIWEKMSTVKSVYHLSDDLGKAVFINASDSSGNILSKEDISRKIIAAL